MPATLQATIAARIDRLDPKAKRTLSAAAVVGSRFGLDLLTVAWCRTGRWPSWWGRSSSIRSGSTRRPEYVFRHPLIRAVGYESQPKSDRAELHRRLALAIEARDPASADENVALIAEHVEAAGDLHAAYGWHMRAATWATNRDIAAARISWNAPARSPISCPTTTRTAPRCASPPAPCCAAAPGEECQNPSPAVLRSCGSCARLPVIRPARRPLNKAVLGLAARTGQGAGCGVRAHAKADIGGKPCPGW